MTDAAWCRSTRGAPVCESSSGLLRYTFSLSERGESAEMVEGRGVNKAARLIRELAAQCVTASWTPERAVARARTAGQKDTDCSVCSPDIVHIWYGTLAPNSLLTLLPFTLYYFMLIEKYYIQHHLSLLPRPPHTWFKCMCLRVQTGEDRGKGGWQTACVCIYARGCISNKGGTNTRSSFRFIDLCDLSAGPCCFIETHQGVRLDAGRCWVLGPGIRTQFQLQSASVRRKKNAIYCKEITAVCVISYK